MDMQQVSVVGAQEQGEDTEGQGQVSCQARGKNIMATIFSCRVCNDYFEPTPSQIRAGKTTCKTCRNKQDRERGAMKREDIAAVESHAHLVSLINTTPAIGKAKKKTWGGNHE